MLYRETALLVDPVLSSDVERQRVAVVVAHELGETTRLQPLAQISSPHPHLVIHLSWGGVTCLSHATPMPLHCSSSMVWKPRNDAGEVLARCGSVWLGVALCGSVWLGVARCSLV